MTSKEESTVFAVGSKLKSIRELLGLSQREVARRAGMTNANLSMIEQGKVSPSITSLEKILSAFPLTLQEFFGSAPVLSQRVFKEQEIPCWVFEQAIVRSWSCSADGDLQIALSEIKLIEGQDFHLRWQNSMRFVVGRLESGSVSLTFGSQQHKLITGEGFQLNPNLPHSVTAIENSRLLCASIS